MPGHAPRAARRGLARQRWQVTGAWSSCATHPPIAEAPPRELAGLIGHSRRNVAIVTSDSAPPARPAPQILTLPAIPASAGALIFDKAGRLLIVKPTYKSGWTIPGGVMEADGETPWEACRREVREETGIDVRNGRLVCMDFRRPRPGKPGGIRFLFRCGPISGKYLATIAIQPEEIAEYRIVALPDALPLLRRPIRRRVRAASCGRGLVYLEDGRPVPAAGKPRSRPGAGGAHPPTGHRL
jgi:8-oxo-dGTP pyrophosphatase MutT (NUDIX family)